MDKVQKGVYEFHKKYGCYVAQYPTIPESHVLLLRGRLIVEEAAEFLKAASLRDMELMADSLGDLLYVVYGAAVAMGLDMEPISQEIQASNMTKDGGGIDSGGKIMKGPNFCPPDLNALLISQGNKPLGER